MSDRLKILSDAGVSVWLDDLSRDRIESGNLAELVNERSVVGVTTNPTIFAGALADGAAYDEQVRELAADGADVERAIRVITTDDVRRACDVLAPVAESTMADGRVSIEVAPRLAHDTEGTLAQARDLWRTVDRRNAFIKIPATDAGLPAITAALAEGISVNVTLIFGIERYKAVMDAWLTGLEQAREAGLDLGGIASVASFFVSRVDGEVDKRLEKLGGDAASSLMGTAAVANARLAHAAFREVTASDRWVQLERAGAQPQRPLWASTGTKNPDYSDTLYVTELVVAGTVNTMPEKTLEAFADHGEVSGDTVTDREDEAQQVLDRIEAVGVDFDDVLAVLEQEGVQKFSDSWSELEDTVADQLESARGDRS